VAGEQHGHIVQILSRFGGCDRMLFVCIS
jgi:hypothetical protein